MGNGPLSQTKNRPEGQGFQLLQDHLVNLPNFAVQQIAFIPKSDFLLKHALFI